MVRRDGNGLLAGDIVAAAVQDYVYDGTVFQMPAAAGKPVLGANLDIYVNAAIGDDANDGAANEVGRALATIQAAVTLAFNYAPSQFTITIHVADGTYNEAVSTPAIPGPALDIEGNSGTPANVLISSTLGSCFTVRGPNTVNIDGVKVACSNSSSAGFTAQGAGATLNLDNTESGAVAGWVFLSYGGASVVVGDHKFSGNIGYGFASYTSGSLQLKGASVYTIAASIQCIAFALVVANGIVEVPATSTPTFVNPSNVIAGFRYAGRLNGVINTQGAGGTYFPGASSSMTSGAQYA